MKLAGKKALITGAAEGIGKGVALVFAAEGAEVCAFDINEAKGNDVLAELQKKSPNSIFVHGDASNNADAETCVKRTVEQFGTIDILVNNAATFIKGSTTALTEEEWERTMNVNVKSMFLFSRLVLPVMMKSEAGVILNMGSVTSLVAVRDYAAYCASKGAIMAYTKAMALDHAEQGIRVNCICPSAILTPQMDEFYSKHKDPELAKRETIAKHPIGRMAKSEELATMLVYLASDEASYITGSVFTFDGGYTAQ